MDRTISAADANRRFSELLRGVREGESFTVTTHGKPVARLTPTGGPDPVRAAARQALLDRLAGQPVQDIGGWSRDDLYER
jgi:prevent-host-death family protein